MGLGWFSAAAVVLGLVAADSWGAQSVVALKGATILSMDGPAVASGTVVIRGEEIAAVGADVEVPEKAQVVDVEGATITPGLIDVWSGLGLAEAAGGTANPLRRAEDGFDRYATAELTEALSQGVTAVYLSPGGPAGVCGTGAVIRLVRVGPGGEAIGRVLRSRAALMINLGSDLGSDARPLARLKALNGIHKQFRDAIEYRKGLKRYEEELAEYKKKLAERAAKEKQGEQNKGKKDGAAATGAPAAEPKEEKREEEKKEEELKKPRRPTRQPKMEILLEALDGRMPVRVLAYRSSDILNALELADAFSLDLILEGAAEAHLVADRLREAGVPVVLGRLDHRIRRRDDVFRRAAYRPGSLLGRAGVRWLVGSGPGGGLRARFVAFNAQLAAAGQTDDLLRRITAEAADFLGVGDRVGRLRPGMLADLVVWSGDPLDPASRVLRVYVGGKLVYEAPDEGEEGSR